MMAPRLANTCQFRVLVKPSPVLEWTSMCWKLVFQVSLDNLSIKPILRAHDKNPILAVDLFQKYNGTFIQ